MAQVQVGEFRIDAKTKVIALHQDFGVKSPRSALGSNKVAKLCIMKHKLYAYPNELEFDFEKDSIEDIMKTYFVWLVDINVNNGVVVLSITNDDTSSKCKGFIAVPRSIETQTSAGLFERQAEYETVAFNQNEAERIAMEELDEYNSYLRGDCYVGVLKKLVKRTSKECGEKYEREEVKRVEGLNSIEECFTYYNT